MQVGIGNSGGLLGGNPRGFWVWEGILGVGSWRDGMRWKSLVDYPARLTGMDWARFEAI